MGFFASSDSTKRAKQAERMLLQTATEAKNQKVEPQKIAPFSDLEKEAQSQAAAFTKSGPSSARQESLSLAQDMARGHDVTELPELNAIFDRILGEGERGARGLARALNITGNAPGSSSKGRDVIGRSLTDVQGRLMEAAAPFLESERNRQFQAIPLIDRLVQAQTDEKLQKIGVGQQVGGQVRELQQLINDADFNARMKELQLRYEIAPSIISGLAGQTEVNGGFVGKVGQIANLGKDVSSIATMIAGAAGGFGVGGLAGAASGMAAGAGDGKSKGSFLNS